MQDNLSYHRFIGELAVELGSVPPDAADLRHAATTVRDDWPGVQDLLTAVVSDPAIAAAVARRSYWHANGFAKLLLHEGPDFSLRLHIWPTDGDAADGSNVHTHRWEFASVVLCGGLYVEEFEETHDFDDPKALVYDKYEYVMPTEGAMGRLLPVGARALRTTSEAPLGAGDVHHCELATIHAVAPFESELTATLFVQGPARTPAAFVYQEEGRAPREDTGVGIGPDEVRKLVKNTLGAMSGSTTGQTRSAATLPAPRLAPAAPNVVLADHEIMAAVEDGSLRVHPFDPAMVRPAALSLRLGRSAYVLRAAGPVDAALGSTYPKLERRDPDDRGRLVFHPGEVVLVPTLERITIPDTLVGVLDGISDVARLGMSVVLAQQVSPGFGAPKGAVLTLEIVSRLETPIYLRPKMRVCNLMLLRCARPNRPYAATPHNHSDDLDAMPSRLADYYTYAAAGFTAHTAPHPAVNAP